MTVGSKGPRGPFSINRASPQANGLVYWLPMDRFEKGGYRNHIGRSMSSNGNDIDAAVTGTPPPSHGIDPLSGMGYARVRDHDSGDSTNIAVVPNTRNPLYLTYNDPYTLFIRARVWETPVGSGDRWTLIGFADAVVDRTGAAIRENISGLYVMSWSHYDGSTYFFQKRTDWDLVVGEWYDWAFTWDGGGNPSGDGEIYKNGEAASTSDALGTAFATDGMHLASPGPNGQGSWDMRDFRIYNRVLSPGEIRALSDPSSRWDLYWQDNKQKRIFFQHQEDFSTDARLGSSIIKPRKIVGNKGPTGNFTINRSSPQARGLVHWWPLNEGKGTNPRDRITGKEPASFEAGPTWDRDTESGMSGIKFPDAADVVFDTTGSPYIGFDVPFTVSYWVIYHSAAVTSADRYQVWYSKVDNNNRFAMGSWESTAGNIRSTISAYDGTTYMVSKRSPFGSHPVGEWRHVVGMMDGAGSASITGRLFINGIETTTAGGGYVGSDNEFALGSQVGNGADMTVRDFRVYNRQLTPGEVQAMYDPATRWDLYQQVGLDPTANFTTRRGSSVGLHPIEQGISAP